MLPLDLIRRAPHILVYIRSSESVASRSHHYAMFQPPLAPLSVALCRKCSLWFSFSAICTESCTES